MYYTMTVKAILQSTATLEAFKDLGLITAATFFDMDQDTDPDLVMVRSLRESTSMKIKQEFLH